MAQHASSGSSETTSFSPSRRTIVAGAAWSIPIVATAAAAPFAAASPCGPSELNWADGYSRTTLSTGNGTITTPSGRQITYTVSAVYRSGSHTPASDTLVARAPGLLFSVNSTVPIGPTPSQPQASNLVLTFSEPVTDLAFNISDIDVYEWVRVSSTVPIAVTRGSALQNINSSGGYNWSGFPNSGNVTETDPTHTATYSAAGPLSQITLQFWRPTSNGGVFLSNMSMQVPC